MVKIVSRLRELLGKKDNLYLCILIGALLLVIAWPVKKEDGHKEGSEEMEIGQGKIEFTEKKYDQKETIEYYAQERGEAYSITDELEKRVEEVLGVTDGVGRVKVMITLRQLGEKVIEKDTPIISNIIVEEDSEGGRRNTTETEEKESTVFYTDEYGNQVPMIVTETLPQIEGITVVCDGGERPEVQKNITHMIQALFDLEPHKIRVVKMKIE